VLKSIRYTREPHPRHFLSFQHHRYHSQCCTTSERLEDERQWYSGKLWPRSNLSITHAGIVRKDITTYQASIVFPLVTSTATNHPLSTAHVTSSLCCKTVVIQSTEKVS
jgi:hypothetical protein